MKNAIHILDRVIQRYTPDPFVFAILLTMIAFALGINFTPSSFKDITLIWGEGFWSLTTFTLQMVMILLGGFILATSTPINFLLKRFCFLARTPHQAILLTSAISCFASWLNWGFGLVAGAFIATEMVKVHKQINYRLLVATAYSGFILWHGGLSGSIPLLLNTEKSFSHDLLGQVTPLDQTIFSPLNISILLTLFITFPLIGFLLSKKSKSEKVVLPKEAEPLIDEPQTPAEKIEQHALPALLVFGLGLMLILYKTSDANFNLDLNQINFILFFLGLIFHKNLRNFINAASKGASKVGPLLIQYPFYAGIMAILKETGLAAQVSTLFVEISNAQTFPVLTFLSAGLLNIFVPSGGGQWAIQGPIVIPAAQVIGANLMTSTMAVAWGDAWTNLLQPFWALPLLAIAQLKIKDILGYCLIYLTISGLIICSYLFIF